MSRNTDRSKQAAIEELRRQQQAPLEPGRDASTGEAKAAFEERHMCMHCQKLIVCSIGRATAEAAIGGWLVAVGDCTEFDPEAVGDESIER